MIDATIMFVLKDAVTSSQKACLSITMKTEANGLIQFRPVLTNCEFKFKQRLDKMLIISLYIEPDELFPLFQVIMLFSMAS